MQEIKAGELSHILMEKEVLHVNNFGDTVIVITSGKNIGTYKSKPFNSRHWVTNIYRKENENWICVMTQEAPVLCK